MSGLPVALPWLIAQNAGAPAGANQSSYLVQMLPIIAIIIFWFYFLLIRPQQKQDRLRRELMSSLKKNDRVITSSGIYGTVVFVDDDQDRVVLRVDDDRNARVTFTKASIARVLDREAEKGKEKEKATETA
jgi:preprotein translocase subunit YajC